MSSNENRAENKLKVTFKKENYFVNEEKLNDNVKVKLKTN